jgi:hypothetical protein
MTTQEHFLMLSLFSKQMQIIKVLLNVMDSHGMKVAEDVPVFELAEIGDKSARDKIAMGMWQNYVALATAMGVTTGLENHPPPSTAS